MGVLALLAGLRPDMRPVAAAELLPDFRLERLPRHDVCLCDLPRIPDWLRPCVCRADGQICLLWKKSYA